MEALEEDLRLHCVEVREAVEALVGAVVQRGYWQRVQVQQRRLLLLVLRHLQAGEREIHLHVAADPVVVADAQREVLGQRGEDGDCELQHLFLLALLEGDSQFLRVENGVVVGVLDPHPQLLGLAVTPTLFAHRSVHPQRPLEVALYAHGHADDAAGHRLQLAGHLVVGNLRGSVSSCLPCAPGASRRVRGLAGPSRR